MLAVESLAFGYPQRTVGRDVSFTLDAGEVMCVLGPNGSGKTTLLRTLLGLLPLREGKIRFNGENLQSLPRRDVARIAGYVPQAHQPYFAYSVRDMVLMGRSAHLGTFSTPGAHDREVATRVLESLGISPLADRPVTEISAGERQLALVARALAQEPASTSATRCACWSASRRSPAAASRFFFRLTIPTTPSSPRSAPCCSPKDAFSRWGHRAR